MSVISINTKTLAILLLLGVLAPTQQAEETHTSINIKALFEERLKINQEYLAEIPENEGNPLTLLTEQESQRLWITFIEAMKESTDEKLKLQFLISDYAYELTNYMYDLEYAENGDEKKEITEKIQHYRILVQKLQQKVGTLSNEKKADAQKLPAHP